MSDKNEARIEECSGTAQVYGEVVGVGAVTSLGGSGGGRSYESDSMESSTSLHVEWPSAERRGIVSGLACCVGAGAEGDAARRCEVMDLGRQSRLLSAPAAVLTVCCWGGVEGKFGCGGPIWGAASRQTGTKP